MELENQSIDFEKAMSKIKKILGDDFNEQLYEDAKIYHPDVIAKAVQKITDGKLDAKIQKSLEKVTKDAMYQDFSTYYPKAFLIFASKLEQHVMKTLVDGIGKQFQSDKELSESELKYDMDVINQAISNYEPIAMKEEEKPEVQIESLELKSYTVSFHASGMNGTANYLVVAKDIDTAKALWETYVKGTKRAYLWERAVEGTKNHYGGYVTWKESKEKKSEAGCYELPYDSWNTSSDHLWD